MGYGIASREAQIVCPYEDLAVLYENAAYRAFAELNGFLGFLYGFKHELFLLGRRLEVRIKLGFCSRHGDTSFAGDRKDDTDGRFRVSSDDGPKSSVKDT